MTLYVQTEVLRPAERCRSELGHLPLPVCGLTR
jgi:hypothetical protein